MDTVKATSKSSVIAFKQKYGFSFKKDLGQNYLVDENIANKIIDALNLNDGDTVLEVGAGMGSLTQIACEKAKKVIAVEIDKKACLMLEEVLRGHENAEIINADFLKTDLKEILKDEINKGESLKFISNMPYYITSPIIMKVLTSAIPFKRIILMLQKEVATRLNAKINTKDYSSFTLAVNYFATAENLFTVPSSAFYPAPKVDSQVIALNLREEKPVKVKDEEFYFKTVRAAFANRRKMVFNSLVNSLGLDKEGVKAALERSGIAENARAENITMEGFALLSDNLLDLK